MADFLRCVCFVRLKNLAVGRRTVRGQMPPGFPLASVPFPYKYTLDVRNPWA